MLKPRPLLGHLFMIMLTAMLSALVSPAQTFSSGSTGADGPLNITAPGVTNFTQVPIGGGNIYNFTTINIAAGSTLMLSGQTFQNPLYFLAQGPVTINGTIDLSGQGPIGNNGIPGQRLLSIPGAGGYPGGIGSLGSNPPEPGSGPGGGAVHGPLGCQGQIGYGGTFTGTSFLIPLIGGSGGGGGQPGVTGGAGGGAILIASSASIIVDGVINANGGGASGGSAGGGGSGGAIRLIAQTFSGNGTIMATGAGRNYSNTCFETFDNVGGPGIVRVEAFQDSFSGSITGQHYTASPYGVFLPSTGPSLIQVVSIGGVAVPSSPTSSFTVPDVTVNSSSPLPIQIRAQNVPVGTTATLSFFSENGPDQTITSTPLSGTLASSTATASITLPPGYSRGYVKASWTQ